MRVWRALLLGGFLAVVWSTPRAHATVDPGTRAALLRAEVQRTMKDCEIPGAAVGVWTPQGNWVEPFGYADVATGRKVKLNDRFAIRSITKSFTVTLLLDLVAQGKVKLDDPISRYYRGVPKGNAVTLRQLAGMSSGVFNYTKDISFLTALGAHPLRHWQAFELIAYALAHPSEFQPGSAYEYSNTNTLLLGEVISRVARKPFVQVLKERILDRLGLDATLYLGGTAIPAPGVKGYDGFLPNGQPDDDTISFSGLGAAGAMASTLGDLHRWGVALAEGTLLPAGLQQQRFWSRVRTNGPLYDRYGLGIGTIDGWWGHTGFAIGYAAAVFHQIEENRTVAILFNSSNLDEDVPAKLFPRLKAIVDTGKAPSAPICRS